MVEHAQDVVMNMRLHMFMHMATGIGTVERQLILAPVKQQDVLIP